MWPGRVWFLVMLCSVLVCTEVFRIYWYVKALPFTPHSFIYTHVICEHEINRQQPTTGINHGTLFLYITFTCTVMCRGVYVPYMPHFIRSYLAAPLPILLGAAASSLPPLASLLGNNAVIIDVSNNQVHLPMGYEPVRLPPTQRQRVS